MGCQSLLNSAMRGCLSREGLSPSNYHARRTASPLFAGGLPPQAWALSSMKFATASWLQDQSAAGIQVVIKQCSTKRGSILRLSASANRLKKSASPSLAAQNNSQAWL